MIERVFKVPGPVARKFMMSPAFVRGIRGPVGSAKSSTSLVELFRLANLQEPMVDGRSNKNRKTRWAIIRNTSPMLKTTTMKSYAEWFPEEVFGEPKMAPPPFEHEIDLALDDGTRLVAEVLFLALDRPEDVRKLLSLELTLAFINEAREANKSIVDGVTSRLRRYPSVREGGATRSCLLMDTNAPDDDHWWPIMAGEAPPPEWMSQDDRDRLVRPADWEFFIQPPAMCELRGSDGRISGYEINPLAENIANLDPKYYPGQIAGKTKQWIDVFIMNRLGSTADGRPVHAQYVPETHRVMDLEPVPGVPFILGIDFGLTPAAVFFQKLRDRYLVVHEIALEGQAAKDLGLAINRDMATLFPKHKILRAWGDPAGDTRAQTDRNTPFQILRALGIPARPAPTNDPELRRLAGSTVLQRMQDGHPAMLIGLQCRVLNAGLGGAWCYKRQRTMDGGERFTDVADKNRFSHTGEAWEYGLVGEGEARDAMLNQTREKREREAREARAQTRPVHDPLARLRRPRSQSLNGGLRR